MMQAVSPGVPARAHRKLSGLGAFVLFVAVALGIASIRQPHVENVPTLTASQMSGIAKASAARVVAAPPARSIAAGPVLRRLPPAVAVWSLQQLLINQDRARYGLRPLSGSSCLATIAHSNAVRMANQGYISHADGAARDLGCHLGYRAGENVGWWSGGVNDGQINTMFINSPEHRANILGPYHYVATAWVTAPNGFTYIAVEFS